MWLAVGFIGVCARLCLWWFSIGSADSENWFRHGMHVATGGLAHTYRSFRDFNHPPLTGLYAALAWRWSGGDLWTFARLIKLPGLLGEALTMAALWRLGGARTFAIYACLPAAILISAYHGNTDCLCVALVLLAAIAFDRGRYFLSGLLWSVALDVKVLPLVLLPLVFVGVPSRKAFLRLGAGFALGLTPFIPPAAEAASAMYRNMLAYNSYVEDWGITALNHGLAIPALAHLKPVWGWWLSGGRYLILISITAVALVSRFRRRIPMIEQTAIGAALFLILAPGFGVQYVIYVAPLLCLVDLKKGLLWGSTSGLFIGLVYLLFIDSWMPLRSAYRPLFPFQATVIGLFAWAVLVHFVWRRLYPVMTTVHGICQSAPHNRSGVSRRLVH
jgi:hypothetical protein